MDELILVDIEDKEIGYGEKTDVHKRGLLHRAFSVFLYDGGKMLIQKRSIEKYHSGGLWTNACCSHPRYGEMLTDAVQRRLHEELGIQCAVEEIDHFTYRTVFSDNLYEYEYDHVFVGKYAGEIQLNQEEASDIRWVSFEGLKKELTHHPEWFTSWFLIACPKVMAYIEKLQNTD